MSGADFNDYIKTVGTVEWSGKISGVNLSEIYIYVGGSASNLLILTTSSAPLLTEAGSNINKTVDFEATITSYQVVAGSFSLIGNLLKIY